MKNFIPKTCSEKLNDQNFCSKCTHQIKDYSGLSPTELNLQLNKEKPYCGIFTTDQNFSTIKPIAQFVALSTLGLIPTTNFAQNHFASISTDHSIQTVKKEFELIIKNEKNIKRRF